MDALSRRPANHVWALVAERDIDNHRVDLALGDQGALLGQPQRRTCLRGKGGENADVANSFLPVAFNLAIFAAGVLGAACSPPQAASSCRSP